MTRETVCLLVTLALVALSDLGCHAYYIPGVNPKSFADGEK